MEQGGATLKEWEREYTDYAAYRLARSAGNVRYKKSGFMARYQGWDYVPREGEDAGAGAGAVAGGVDTGYRLVDSNGGSRASASAASVGDSADAIGAARPATPVQAVVPADANESAFGL